METFQVSSCDVVEETGLVTLLPTVDSDLWSPTLSFVLSLLFVFVSFAFAIYIVTWLLSNGCSDLASAEDQFLHSRSLNE